MPSSRTYDKMLSNPGQFCAKPKLLTSGPHVRSIHRRVPAIAPVSALDRGNRTCAHRLVFDLLQPSCYSNAEFSRTMDYSNGNFVIAGMFGETTCLSTAIDAHHRRQNFTYIADATACLGGGRIPSYHFHDTLSQIMSLDGTVTHWSHMVANISRGGKEQYEKGVR